MSSTQRHHHLAALLQDPSKLSTAKVLMVGAGGIGCELLKNLVMTGFKTIEVVDLDTIDLSNLNRQFLFRNKDIRKSKAHVAKEAAIRFNPSVNIISHHSSIYEEQFDVRWFGNFDIVLNALDNLQARRYVNLMCLAADVPLVESGTAGYFGQASDITHCFDCEPKPTPKTFAVCTIRSTPSQPLHCIVWAKNYLFSELFGMKETSEIIEETTEENDETRNQKRESAELATLLKSSADPKFTELIFEKVFEKDINTLLSMEDLWISKDKPRPKPLLLREVFKGSDSKKFKDDIERSHNVWSVRTNAEIFLSSLKALTQRLENQRAMDPGSFISFDKDDDEVMDFVTAATNLRSAAYGLEILSRFKAKEMAGNIIPAVATTNAIVAGLIVLEAIKVLNGDWSKCKHTHVRYGNKRRMLLSGESLPTEAAEDCASCRDGFLTLAIDTERFTIANLVELVIRDNSGASLGFDGDITINEGSRMLYDDDFTDNEMATFAAMNLTNAKRLTITHEVDADHVSNVLVFIVHRVDNNQNPSHFEIIGEVKAPKLKKKPKPAPAPGPADNKQAETNGKKRKLDSGDGDDTAGSSAQKRKIEVIVDDDEIL
ncbi:E1 ubiquitin-activating protein uba2 [Phlyctochytrium planicorne]|nr:E1 ubiquitin-activating protein uba2 [Phlyctochytrium planicorne]